MLQPSQCVEILVGMIASGKSAYARQAAAEGKVIIDHDAIVTGLHGGNYTLYLDECKPLYKSVETHILTSALLMGKTVVVDHTNLTVSRRARLIGLARAFDVPAKIIIFPFAALGEHAKRRFDSDPRGYTYQQWHRVAVLHAQEYEIPSMSEGCSEIIYVPQRREEAA